MTQEVVGEGGEATIVRPEGIDDYTYATMSTIPTPDTPRTAYLIYSAVPTSPATIPMPPQLINDARANNTVPKLFVFNDTTLSISIEVIASYNLNIYPTRGMSFSPIERLRLNAPIRNEVVGPNASRIFPITTLEEYRAINPSVVFIRITRKEGNHTDITKVVKTYTFI